MVNSPEAYTDAGRKAGTARRRHDEALARFLTDWYRRARRVEAEADRVEVDRLFTEGYRAAAAPRGI